MSDNVRVPSLWPIRHQRRDAAIARDRAHSESRFQGLEKAIASIHCKLDEVLSRIEQPLPPPPGLQSEEIKPDKLIDITTRVERIEFLLLRTSLSNSEIIDTEIPSFLLKASATVCPDVVFALVV